MNNISSIFTVHIKRKKKKRNDNDKLQSETVENYSRYFKFESVSKAFQLAFRIFNVHAFQILQTNCWYVFAVILKILLKMYFPIFNTYNISYYHSLIQSYAIKWLLQKKNIYIYTYILKNVSF